MADVIDTTIRYDADLSSAMAQVKALTAQIATLNTAFLSLDKAAQKTRADLATAFMTNVSGIGNYTGKVVEMTSATDNFGKALQRNKLTMSQYFAEAYRGITRQDSMMRQYARQQAKYMESITVPLGTGPGGKSIGAVITPNELDMRNLQTRMNVANQQFNTFRHLVNQGSTEMINFGKNTQWTGRQLTVGLTMPILLFSSTFAKAFMDIDKELTRFAKVYGEDLVNSNNDATERMKGQVIDLAKTISSQFGVAASETAALAADIAATGKTGQDLLDTVSQTSRLAVLGEVDRQDAMKATLAIQSAFKQNTNELAESINFLNAIENQTSTTLNDLVEAIPKAGPVIKGLGGSIKDLSVLMVAMKEGGIPAAEAANAIKSGMASLINPTKKASDTAKQFGVDLVGIVNANKGQLMPTLFAVQNALSGLSDFAKSRVIEEIFGKYQFARISALFNNLGKAGSQTQQAMELAGASTTELAAIANKELKAYTESTTVRFQRMVETVKNQLLPLGQALLEGLIPVLEKVSGAIDTISGFMKNLPEPVKNFGKIIGGLTLVAGPVLMLVGLFKQLIGNGIKAAMSVVTLAAKLGGIKVGPLEHLDEHAMAANTQISNLTKSFVSQEVALSSLNKEMALYLGALRNAAAVSPTMFAPPIGGRPTPRRAMGGALYYSQGGGAVSGPGGPRDDKILAFISNGEYVVNADAVKKYGIGFMDNLNAKKMARGGIAGYADGNLVTRNVAGYEMSFLRKVAEGKNLDPLISKISQMLSVESNLNEDQKKQIRDVLSQMRGTTVGISELTKRLNALGIEHFSGRMGRTDPAGRTRPGQAAAAAIAQRQAFEGLEYKRAQTAVRAVDYSPYGVVTGSQLRNLTQIQAGHIRVIQGQAKSFEDLSNLTPQLGAINNYYNRIEKALVQIDKNTGNTISPTQLHATLAKRMNEEAGKIVITEEQVAAELADIKSGAAPIGEQARSVALAFAKLDDELSMAALGAGQAKTALGTISRTGYQARAYVGAEAAMSGMKYMTLVGEDIIDGIRIATKTASPSKEAEKIGRDYGIGLNNGVRAGLKSGPVGAGIESRTATSVYMAGQGTGVQAQQKYDAAVARRVRAEVERAALIEQQAAIAKRQAAGEITAQEALRQRIALNEKIRIEDDKIAKNKMLETRYSGMVTRAQERRIAAETELASMAQAQRRAPQRVDMSGMSREERRALAEERRMAAGFYGPTPAAAGKDNGREPRTRGAMGGAGAMNAMFGLSTVLSTITMFGDQTSEASANLQKFSMALMGVSSMMMMMQGTGAGGLLGKAAGGVRGVGVSLAARGMNAAAAGGAGIGSRLMTGAGGLLAAGGGAAPIAIGAVAITAAVTAYVLYKKAAEEARQRAIAAFADPAKSAEYFGKKIRSVKDAFKELNLKNVGVDTEKIDQALRDAVKEDYGPLIQKIKYTSAEAGAKELGMAFNKMLLSGLSGEEATAAIEAIAVESGARGANAFSLGVKNNMFKADMTNEERIAAIAAQFDPTKNTALQKSLLDAANNSAEVYAKQTSGIENRFAAYVPDFLEFMQNEEAKAVKESKRTADQISQSYLESVDVTANGLISMTEQMSQAFKLDPDAAIQALNDVSKAGIAISEGGAFDTGPIKDYLKEIDGLAGNTLSIMIDQAEANAEAMSGAIMKGLAAGLSLAEIQKILQEKGIDGLNVEVQLRIDIQNIENTLNDMKKSLQEGLVGDLEKKLKAGQNAYENLQTKLEDYTAGRQDLRDQMEKDFETEQEGIQEGIDGMQDQIDAIEKVTEKKREQAQEAIDALEKEKDLITESTDKYLESIRKRSQADNFYTNQRKNNMSALGKLASGDVFGFLVDRQQMQGEATQYAYDEEIRKIEENRDAQVEAIDDAIEKKNEEVEEFEKAQKRKTDALQEEIDKQQDVMDANEKTHEAQMKEFDEATRAHQTSLNNRITQQQTYNGKIQRSIDDAKSNRMVSEEDLTELLGEEEGKRYSNTQLNVLRQMYLFELAKQQQAGETIDQNKAVQTIRPFYLQAFPPGSRFINGRLVQNDITNEEILSIINERNPIPPEQRAMGGYISGPGGPTDDKIPAYLSNGEYVIRASSVNKYGKDFLDAINTQKFADGGPVELKKSIEKWVGRKAKFYGGWDSAGDWPSGGPFGSLMHHTAKRLGMPQVNAMRDGYDGFKGPIVQSVVTADGTAHIIGYGGRGLGAGPSVGGEGGRQIGSFLEALVRDHGGGGGFANTSLYQIEVDSDGKVKDFTTAQFDSIARIHSALREFAKWPSFDGRIINHKDWARGRPRNQKNDTLYDKSIFIENANRIWSAGSGAATSGDTSSTPSTTGPSTIVGGRIRNVQSYQMDRSRSATGMAKFIQSPMLGIYNPGTPGTSGSASGSPSGSPSDSSTPAPSGDYSADRIQGANLVKLIKQVGFSGDDIRTAYGVVWGESNGYRKSINRNKARPGGLPVDSIDFGLFQINNVANKTVSGLGSIDFGSKIFDAVYNSTVAKYIKDERSKWREYGYDGWLDWNAYKNKTDEYKRGLKDFDNNPSWSRYAYGGNVSGPGGPKDDMIPAMLSNGEYVVQASSVKKYGKGVMDQINAGMFGMGGMAKKFNMPRYAVGGPVGQIPSMNKEMNSEMTITINANGITDPEVFAKKVVTVIERKQAQREHARMVG